MEHFAAAAFSVDHTRSMDGVRMVVAACVAAIGDAVMRQVALDIPSEVCVHLRGDGTSKRPGFALGAAALAQQCAVVPVHTAELNVARTCCLDYFGAQAGHTRVWPWEKTERLEKGTSKWMKLVCADLAFPGDGSALPLKHWPRP